MKDETRIIINLIWAVCAAFCMAILCINGFWAWRDRAAIEKGLHQTQSVQRSGGYWVAREKGAR